MLKNTTTNTPVFVINIELVLFNRMPVQCKGMTVQCKLLLK